MEYCVKCDENTTLITLLKGFLHQHRAGAVKGQLGMTRRRTLPCSEVQTDTNRAENPHSQASWTLELLVHEEEKRLYGQKPSGCWTKIRTLT